MREKASYLDWEAPIIPVREQVALLSISRSAAYYEPRPTDEMTLQVMHGIDEVYTAHPYYGSRRIAKELSRQLGEAVNRKCVQRLMQAMGIEAIYPKPRLSLPGGDHIIYPYLLRNVRILHPNQVWGTDITYIRMFKGFLYLVVFLDWFSRYVLSWRLSTTLETAFCIEAAEEAFSLGTPEMTNSDQGVQFTSRDYLALWENKGVQISMDGRGRALDNIFTERLWRSVKYEEVYLKHYESVAEAKEGLGAYFQFYNNRRLHQALGYKTPAEVYFGENVSKN